MATLMPLCAGLVGPKSENVEIPLVLPLFFEGPSWQKDFRKTSRPPRSGGFDIEKVDFWLKWFVSIWGIVLPAEAGSTFL